MQHTTVISLLPSATDTVVALGCTNMLIGHSHECEWDGMESQQHCSSSVVVTKNRLGDRIPIEEIQDVFSASIAAVEEMKMLGPGLAVALIQYGLSVYHVDVDTLVSLRPDVILTCLQTAHSGVLEGDLCEAAFENVLGYVPKIVHTNGQTMEEIYSDMQRISDALGVPERGEELVSGMKQRMKDIEDESKQRGGVRPSVACIQWPHPLLTCGAWVPELMHMVGAHVVAGPDGPGSTIDMEDMSNADVIVFALCGLGMDVSEQTVRNRILKNAPVVDSIPQAVLDGVRMMSRPGPLLLQSLECLEEILHDYRHHHHHHHHEGSSSRRFPETKSGSGVVQQQQHKGSLWKWV
jgi:iron complex transport system substrate-binding protein